MGNTDSAIDKRTYPFSDLALSRRLERAEGSVNVDFVEARAKLEPSSKATWLEVAGAFAMFDGVGSPLTQTFGLGLFDRVGESELELLESFFESRGADVFHEVSPLGQSDLPGLLAERSYRPVESTSILYRPVSIEIADADRSIVVRECGDDETEIWSDTAARGWGETGEIAEFIRMLGRIGAASRGTIQFIAELDGAPVATGALGLHGEVAVLAGASTVPEGRGRGAQLALLGARLRHAAARGAELATMSAHPGSASQRNAERQGFRIAYTRTKWGRERA